jgi:hypothetical protein
MSGSRQLPRVLFYALPGAALGFAAAALISLTFGRGTHAIWWWPAGAVALAFAGSVLGLILEEEIEDGRAEPDDGLERGRLRSP